MIESKSEKDSPLVSIIVITYNSSKYVLETLESARLQTYGNIELIVSDDCSADNTVEVCRNWIEENRERFARTNLITTLKNSGISPNCNRGLYAAEGEWVKLIAGDDILLSNAIQILVDKVNSDNTIQFLFGGCKIFTDDYILPEVELPDSCLKEMNAKKQYKYLLTHTGKIHGPTSFLNRKKLLELSGYDESIPFSEDWPLWIKATQNQHRLYFIDDAIALYRKHENGIYSKTLIGLKADKKLADNVNLIREKYIIPNLLKDKQILNAFYEWIILKKERTNSKLLKLLFKSLLLFIPKFYIIKLKRKY
jgi:alpha-1,3-rhamnosyltransferase